MIKTRKELQAYIEQDLKNNLVQLRGARRWLFVHANPRLHFIYNLRYYEYYHNNGGLFCKIMKLWHYFIHKQLSYKLGFTIYANQFGPGLYIGHYGTIVVNKACRIGANCTILVCGNIGMGGKYYW